MAVSKTSKYIIFDTKNDMIAISVLKMDFTKNGDAYVVVMLQDLVKDAIIDLERIMENWCESFSNHCTGGEMRGYRGADTELFVMNLINNIGKHSNRNFIAKKGSEDKKELKLNVDGKEVKKQHQVDIHIYLDDQFIGTIECKAYLDSCYYVRACDDFKLFKKFGYNLKNYVFSLEENLNWDTKLFTDHISDYVCDDIFFVLDGKRNKAKPVYDRKSKKQINSEKLERFVNAMYSLCND